MKKIFLHIILLASFVLLSLSCAEQEIPHSGQVSLSFSTGSFDNTKAPAVADPSDGSGIYVDSDGNPDLIIAIANQTGAIIAWYPHSETGITYESSCLTVHTADTPATESTIYFSGIARGSYSVFAIANTRGLTAATKTAISNSTTVSAIEAITLSTENQPSYGDYMPLTAKGTLSVNSSGNGQADLDLLRPVARVTLTFKNLTESTLTLHNCAITLKSMNPSSGYLFKMSPDYISGNDRDLILSSTDPLTVPIIDPQSPTSVNTLSLPSKLVFPSIAPAQTLGNRYLCDIEFIIFVGETPHQYSYSNLPVHDRRSEDILALSRNQHLQIETRISKQGENHDISFNFEVASWTEVPQEIHFD